MVQQLSTVVYQCVVQEKADSICPHFVLHQVSPVATPHGTADAKLTCAKRTHTQNYPQELCNYNSFNQNPNYV